MAKFSDSDVLQCLRSKIDSNGLRATARELGFSAPFISDVAKGSRRLSEAMAEKLGFVLVSAPPPPPPPRIWEPISKKPGGNEK